LHTLTKIVLCISKILTKGKTYFFRKKQIFLSITTFIISVIIHSIIIFNAVTTHFSTNVIYRIIESICIQSGLQKVIYIVV